MTKRTTNKTHFTSLKKQLRQTLELVTPEMAKEWLGTNYHNRKKSSAHVIKLAKAIERGEWQTTHEGVAFDVDGNLIDGQHRLEAIILANTAIYMFVCRGLPRSAQGVMGRQRIRSLADDLQMAGEKHAKTKVAFARVIWSLEHPEARANDENLLVEGEINETRLLFLDGIEKALTHNTRGLSSAVVRGAFAWAFGHGMPVDYLYERFMTGVGVFEGDPANVLRSYLLTNRGRLSGKNRREILLKICNVIFYDLEEKPLRKLYPGRNGYASLHKMINGSAPSEGWWSE